MILLILSATAAIPAGADEAMELCRPALARKIDGEIETLTPTSVRKKGRKLLIEGQLTAFLGMPKPAPGSASAHHLIRAEFDFRCRTSGGRVRRTSVTPHQW